MAITNLTIAVAQDGTKSIASQSERSFMEAFLDGVTLPLGVTAEDTEYVQKNQAAYATIGYGLTGFLLGEAYGHKRASNGSQSFIPVFR